MKVRFPSRIVSLIVSLIADRQSDFESFKTESDHLKHESDHLKQISPNFDHLKHESFIIDPFGLGLSLNTPSSL